MQLSFLEKNKVHVGISDRITVYRSLPTTRMHATLNPAAGSLQLVANMPGILLPILLNIKRTWLICFMCSYDAKRWEYLSQTNGAEADGENRTWNEVKLKKGWRLKDGIGKMGNRRKEIKDLSKMGIHSKKKNSSSNISIRISVTTQTVRRDSIRGKCN